MWIFVPQQGIKPAPHAVEAQSLNYWTAREVSSMAYFFNEFYTFWQIVFQKMLPINLYFGKLPVNLYFGNSVESSLTFFFPLFFLKAETYDLKRLPVQFYKMKVFCTLKTTQTNKKFPTILTITPRHNFYLFLFGIYINYPWKDKTLPIHISMVFGGLPGGTSGKEAAYQCKRWKRCIWSLGRSLGGGHGNPPQYSCLENPLDRIVWQATVYRVTQSWTVD